MDKTYQPDAIETRWYQQWEQQGYFAPGGTGRPYSITIPPPNITGSLHMGHAFQHTIMDALCRYKRMAGYNTLWQVGTDHAGIATQMVVERKLAADSGQSRHDLGREAFIRRIWDWKTTSGGSITSQMRRLGNSVDWATERFTMDPGFSRAVQQAFIRLYRQGLIYRGKRLVNWDPQLHTAISDLEVENCEEPGFLWHFRYPLCNGASTRAGDNFLVVATTRPETMLGDTAVAVNARDERYNNLLGQTVELPLVGRRIPIVADDHAAMDKGTGCVKITPAHDFNDYQVGQRHRLPMLNVFTPDAAIRHTAEVYNCEGEPDTAHTAALPAKYAGLDRYEARRQIVADLDALGLVDSIKDHVMQVPRGDRSGLVIEPMLTSQWFVDAKALAAPALEAVASGQITFVPQQYENMYYAWLRDLQDWCISRQLWWGHRIPAWYDDAGNIYVGTDEAAVRAEQQLGDDVCLQQDDDVLDTWFSSALWTFGTLGWPQATERLQTFHPTDVLVTGFDIIFFWVARMIMMTMHLLKDADDKPQIPFKTVYVTGLIRDENGDKMSKSKGNVLDPLDMIDGIDLASLLEKRTGNMMQPQRAAAIAQRTRQAFPNGIAPHGTDALRFTLARLASTGRDINWDMKRLEGYRNFCNKLWNAARFVLMHTEGQDCGQQGGTIETSVADRWITSELQATITSVNTGFNNYRFDLVAQRQYEFIWDEYCSWYLELCKPILNNADTSAAQLRGTRKTLVGVLETVLRLAHPIMPFITEEIWQALKPLAGKTGPSIMLEPYPVADPARQDATAVESINWAKGIITALRNIRAELNVPPGRHIPVLLANTTAADQTLLAEHRQLLCKLARLANIQLLAADEAAPMAAIQLSANIEVLVPMAGLIDKTAELARIKKEQQKLQTDSKRISDKLNNANFIDKAPAAVVEKQQQKLAELQAAAAKLTEQAERIDRM